MECELNLLVCGSGCTTGHVSIINYEIQLNTRVTSTKRERKKMSYSATGSYYVLAARRFINLIMKLWLIR